MTMKKIYYSLCLVALCTPFAQAQDDLSALLAKENTNKTSEPVFATFKTTRLINAQSTEMLKKRNLDFRVAHRFGNLGTDADQLVENFFVSSDIRIAFEYGVTDNFTVGISRNKVDKAIEGFVKWRPLTQTVDDKIPVSVALFANTAVNTNKDPNNVIFEKEAHRMSYVFQGVIARKFSSDLSLELIPSLVHRNFVKTGDNNDVFSLGVGGRYKVSRSSAIIFDYFYNFRKNNVIDNVTYYNPLGIGWEIETGGHVFSLMLTNSTGIIENQFITNTTDSWLKGGFKFSFNISRIFKL